MLNSLPSPLTASFKCPPLLPFLQLTRHLKLASPRLLVDIQLASNMLLVTTKDSWVVRVMAGMPSGSNFSQTNSDLTF